MTKKKKLVGGNELLVELLERLNNAFGGSIPAKTLKIYLEELSGLNTGFDEIAQGFRMAIVHERRFPPLAVLLGYLPKKKIQYTSDHEGLTTEDRQKLKMENERLDDIRKFFDNDDEKKFKYVRYWIKLAYGPDAVEEFANRNQDYMLMEKPAMFDLMENGYKLEGLERVIKKNNEKARKKALAEHNKFVSTRTVLQERGEWV